MLLCMRTTVRLDESLMKRAKRKAAEEGTTFTALVEEGLRVVLAEPSDSDEERRPVPISKRQGGIRPGVDLNSNAALQDLLEENGEWS